MSSPRTLLVALLLVALPLAGCFGSEVIPNERTFSASGGKVSAGWAYDGAGLEAASATLTGTVQNAENTGNITAAFQYAGSEWTVTFDEFAQTADFQDGGVAFDLLEHGDTGIGDASLPTILAKVAIWGNAKLTRDGEPALSVSGKDTWNAHLMISDTTVRGADGKVAKADGSTPYDPAAPADATRVEGDAQAFLVLKSPDGVDTMRAPVVVSSTSQFLGPESTQTVDIPTEKGTSLLLNVTATGGSAPVGAGTVTFTLVDETGTAIDSKSGNVLANTPYTATFEVPDAPGPLTLQITGQGAFTATIDGTISYDDHPFLVITWDDVTLS